MCELCQGQRKKFQKISIEPVNLLSFISTQKTSNNFEIYQLCTQNYISHWFVILVNVTLNDGFELVLLCTSDYVVVGVWFVRVVRDGKFVQVMSNGEIPDDVVFRESIWNKFSLEICIKYGQDVSELVEKDSDYDSVKLVDILENE